jgi:hypothetical protein
MDEIVNGPRFRIARRGVEEHGIVVDALVRRGAVGRVVG